MSLHCPVCGNPCDYLIDLMSGRACSECSDHEGSVKMHYEGVRQQGEQEHIDFLNELNGP